MEKAFEEINTFKKLQDCYNCMMKGELNLSVRNYFWELNSILYRYNTKNQLLITKEELLKVKFFNIKLMRVYNFPECYIQDIENFNALERKIRENENNAGTTI